MNGACTRNLVARGSHPGDLVVGLPVDIAEARHVRAARLRVEDACIECIKRMGVRHCTHQLAGPIGAWAGGRSAWSDDLSVRTIGRVGGHCRTATASTVP